MGNSGFTIKGYADNKGQPYDIRTSNDDFARAFREVIAIQADKPVEKLDDTDYQEFLSGVESLGTYSNGKRKPGNQVGLDMDDFRQYTLMHTSSLYLSGSFTLDEVIKLLKESNRVADKATKNYKAKKITVDDFQQENSYSSTLRQKAGKLHDNAILMKRVAGFWETVKTLTVPNKVNYTCECNMEKTIADFKINLDELRKIKEN